MGLDNLGLVHGDLLDPETQLHSGLFNDSLGWGVGDSASDAKSPWQGKNSPEGSESIVHLCGGKHINYLWSPVLGFQKEGDVEPEGFAKTLFYFVLICRVWYWGMGLK